MSLGKNDIAKHQSEWFPIDLSQKEGFGEFRDFPEQGMQRVIKGNEHEAIGFYKF
jgi:hypothetical protein